MGFSPCDELLKIYNFTPKNHNNEKNLFLCISSMHFSERMLTRNQIKASKRHSILHTGFSK